MQTIPFAAIRPFLANGRPIRLRPTPSLGQFTWGTPAPSTSLPAGTKCYKCGIQPPRPMTPTMAAMVPGGCVEVLASECGAAPATATGGISPTPTPTSPSGGSTVSPPPSDPIAAEIAQKQALWKQVYEQQLLAWNYATAGPGQAQIASFAADQAHAAVANFSHPDLRANWDSFSWWVGDLGILPTEWPELVKNHKQFSKIWAAVPWPEGGELDDLFTRCSRGLVISNGLNVVSPRLYVNRFSGFWPKTDEEIRRTIAKVALEGIPQIYACMEHKVRHKIKDEERQMRKWQIIGMAAGMLFTGNLVATSIFNAASQMAQFNDAEEFSKFMMGYAEFVEACAVAEQEDFTCRYLAPFVLWAMETLYMGEFFDWVAMESGLPGAREGLTQEEVIEPMVKELEDAGVDIPKAAQTPGGVAKGPSPLLIAGGVGALGVIALLVSGVLTK